MNIIPGKKLCGSGTILFWRNQKLVDCWTKLIEKQGEGEEK